MPFIAVLSSPGTINYMGGLAMRTRLNRRLSIDQRGLRVAAVPPIIPGKSDRHIEGLTGFWRGSRAPDNTEDPTLRPRGDWQTKGKITLTKNMRSFIEHDPAQPEDGLDIALAEGMHAVKPGGDGERARTSTRLRRLKLAFLCQRHTR